MLGDWNSNLHLTRKQMSENISIDDEHDQSDDDSSQSTSPIAVPQYPVINTIDTNQSLGTNAWLMQYRVPLYNIDINGDSIDYNYALLNRGMMHGEGAFFDNGTTFLYVAPDMYTKITKKFGDYCLKGNGRCGGYLYFNQCFKMEVSKNKDLNTFFNSFPVINFDFGAEELYKWYPSDYLIKKGSTDDYCIGIKSLKNMILGGVFWRNYDLFFDKETRQVKFVRADCSKSGKVDTYDYKEMEDALFKVNQPMFHDRHIYMYVCIMQLYLVVLLLYTLLTN